MQETQIPKLSENEIAEGLKNAYQSPRRRHPMILHKPGAEFNQVFNFNIHDTYMQPHLHPGDEKIEEIHLVRGEIAVIFFDDTGRITKVTQLAKGKVELIRVPAFTWHTYVMLTENAISYETMMGKYDPNTWKKFAAWAPKEDSTESTAYLGHLKRAAVEATRNEVDPKSKNQLFSDKKITTYLNEYVAKLRDCLFEISPDSLESARQLLFKTRKEGGRIFVGGNGGSAAISEHLCCDWHKGVHQKSLADLQVTSLVSNTALLTAIANDFGYENVFSYQLKLSQLTKRDVVVLISSSGNSENIVKAAEYARSCGAQIVALTGFSGGKLRAIADVSLHVPYDNYGLIEDAHQALMHILAQFHDIEFARDARSERGAL